MPFRGILVDDIFPLSGGGMDDFNTALIREKIIFVNEDGGPAPAADGHSVIRSNRVFLKLERDGQAEKVVVRAQNMHTTLRLAGKVMQEFYRMGLLQKRANLNWEDIWQGLQSNYEREYNSYNWGAIYVNGHNVFKTKQSAYVDIIEKCAQLSVDNYDATIEVAQSALKQLGKSMQISQSSTVAAVFTDTPEHLRVGIIHRQGGKDTAFNFTAAGGEAHHRVVQTLGIAAALLEAINLKHVIENLREKSQGRKPSPADAAQLRTATARLLALDKGISSFEDVYEVRYRPEKPVFLPAETREIV
jgi:predicted kinase